MATKKPRIEVKLYGGVDSTPLQLFSELFGIVHTS